jgi:hypothetical protein
VGATFSPWTITRNANGDVLFAPGTWRDADGGAIEPPEALALAAVQAGPVVDSEGVTEVTGRNLQAMPRVAVITDAGADADAGPMPTATPNPGPSPSPTAPGTSP